MDPELLLSLTAKVADERHVRGVLDAIVHGLAELPGVALTRIWLLRPGDLCTECSLRDECRDRASCLHLVAGAGRSQAGSEEWAGLQDSFRRIPLHYGKVGGIGATGESVQIHTAVSETQCLEPDWITREGVQGFSGHALISQDKVLGVMAVFTRTSLTDKDAEQLRTFASLAAAAIANAQAFEELDRAEAGLRQVADVVRHHLTIIDPGLRAVFANRAAKEYFGLSAPLSAEEFLWKVTHPDDAERLIGGLKQAVSTGQFFEIEARMCGKDGQYRWFLYQLYPLQDAEGRAFRWCAVRTDIDEQKRVQERAQRENLVLREEIDKLSMSEEIVGTSLALQTALARVAKVAATDSTVLITGETGTGKELIARAIHKQSSRAGQPFVSVNCAAIPKELIPSELFGHERGAFTGALQRRLGRFEVAEGGSIFLDEIGELPAETQVALLRVLQEREFQRVGSNQVLRSDVRVIAATHRDLLAAIEAGAFRSDLFYRINVFPIHIPPLRERKEDIRLLVEYFIHRFAVKTGKQIRHIEKKSLERLEVYPWPGNIRELQNVIERSVILCESDRFSVDESWLSDNRAVSLMPETLVTQEREMIETALAASRGRISGPSGAATKLGMARSTLDSRIKALKIDKRRFQSA